jgi:hypothetical protein
MPYPAHTFTHLQIHTTRTHAHTHSQAHKDSTHPHVVHTLLMHVWSDMILLAILALTAPLGGSEGQRRESSNWEAICAPMIGPSRTGGGGARAVDLPYSMNSGKCFDHRIEVWAEHGGRYLACLETKRCDKRCVGESIKEKRGWGNLCQRTPICILSKSASLQHKPAVRSVMQARRTQRKCPRDRGTQWVLPQVTSSPGTHHSCWDRQQLSQDQQQRSKPQTQTVFWEVSPIFPLSSSCGMESGQRTAHCRLRSPAAVLTLKHPLL